MLDKEESKSKLKELVEQFASASKNKDYINAQNEEWVKWNYIEPLLEILGWKRGDIEKEYRVLKGRADYLLKIGNEEVLVVEAKKVSVSLTEEEGRQAVSYAYHRKIKFAILTNFKEVRVYHALSNIRNIDRNLLKFESGGYFRFTFEQFIDNFDKLGLLSRENIEKKELNKLLSKKDEKASKLIDESILDDLLEIREWLSKDLKKLKADLTKEQIDEIVQILIDRLIFMRSVEDRGLEERDFLLKMTKDFQEGRTEKRLWESLKIKFKIFDKEYNSKLFAEGILEKEGSFDEQTLIKVIRELYFGNEGQQERYMFDEIPGDLLGTIYEQYLGTILEGTEKRVKLDATSGKRKKMGIYYTPSYIVDYIVKNTVYEYIKDKKIDEILEINIVDPACGSGSFLIKAFECVCKVIEEKLKKGERGKIISFHDYKERLSLGQKATILTSCIYGVDLDEKAIELAQLNLLLKLLEEETRETRKRILPNMKDNIKCGNSLIDDASIAGDKAFKWEAQFPEVFHKGGFDVVIGNPPYINNVNLPIKDKVFYSNKYLSAIEQYDIYVLFFEKGMTLLRENGLLGYITPNKYLIAKYGKNLREYFLSKEVLKIVDVSNLDVFKDASTYSIITLIKNLENRNNNLKIYSNIVKPLDIYKEPPDFVLNQNELKKNKDFVFEINIGKGENQLFSKLSKNSLLLGEVSDVKKGIETGGDKNFILEAKDLDSLSLAEKKNLVKLITSRDIKRYVVVYSGRKLIYNIEKLKGPRNRNIFETEKIITCRTVKRLSFAYDDSNAYLTDTNQVLLLKDNKISLKYLLAILNSNLINYFYSRKFESSHMRGGYFRCFKQYLDQIPIKMSERKKENSIIDLVDQMLSLQKKLHESTPSGNEKERLEQQIKNVDYKIDQEVYILYGITREEQKMIEESLG